MPSQKKAPLTGLVFARHGKERETPIASGRIEVKTTCPRDCYDSCGVSVLLEDGRIRSVKGDAGHFVSQGSLCGKCSLAYNGAWIDPVSRLTVRLRRIGPKGTGQSVRRVRGNSPP